MAFRLGIDLGGTKIEAVIIDEQFQVVKRKRVPTNREEGYEAIIETIISLSKSMIDGYEEFEGPIGICTPGTIEAETGLLKNSNTVCLIGKPIQKDMESELGIPVLMENDANCFALAEATLGAAKKYNVVFGVILGTGCGGGITMLKNIHRGANRIAGEWGHHCLHPGGRDCYWVIKDVLKHIFLEPHLKKNGTKSLVKSIGLPILLIAECTKIILDGKQIF